MEPLARAPTGSNLYLCEKHVSPPGLEPGSLEYRSNALTTKLRRHMMKKHAFHTNVPSDGYTSIPYTPLPRCFLK